MATQAIPQVDPGTPQNVVKHGARLTRSEMVHLAPEELLAILKTARVRSTRDWTMMLLAYRHGLRASEVCDLKMADVDLKAGPLSIRWLKGSLHTVQPLYRHKGQPLLDEVSALRAWLRERQPDGSDYVFVSQKGGRLHRSQFFRIVQVCAEAAGLGSQKRHPHALKHSGSDFYCPLLICLVRALRLGWMKSRKDGRVGFLRALAVPRRLHDLGVQAGEFFLA
jgi:integrase